MSLSRTFLIGVGLTTASIALVASALTFAIVRSDLGERQMRHQAEYLQERATNLSRRFEALSAIHQEAAAELTSAMDRLSPSEAARLVDRRLPLQADGTRRSTPDAFDGALTADGAYVHGLGAFIGAGAKLEGTERTAIAASLPLVEHFGQAIHTGWDNFYFATPNNRVVIYGPDRPDRLRFYRQEAKADLDFRQEEMMKIVSPAADPTRETRCTSLQRLIQDEKGQRLATACMTPFYYQGRYVGAFGSSILLNDFLTTATQGGMGGGVSLVVRRAGDILAYPGLKPGEPPSPASLEREAKTYAVPDLMRVIADANRDRGLFKSPDGRNITAYARIPGPDWYLLLLYPTRALGASAFRPVAWLLALGLLTAAAQTVLLFLYARRQLVSPLQLLAASCAGEPIEAEALETLRARGDEIGVLSRALAAERDNNQMILASLEERVLERTAELEAAVQEKSRFLANMSHELRTPLNGVIAVSEALCARQTDDEAREMASLVVTSSRLLERVLGDILDFSSLENGAVALAPEPFELKALVQQVAELHQTVARSKGLELRWSILRGTPQRFVGDAVRITQIVTNLLSNAVKFTDKGWVELRVAHAGGALQFTVIDTGIGFDAATHERLFQRFEQADASIRRRFGGTGLGLAICHALVEGMGGEIVARSSLGVGSMFQFSLPLPQAVAPPAANDAVEVRAEPRPVAGVRILLAEDHPTNQTVIRLILEAMGVELAIVADGRAALDAMEAQSFDLVLMDMQMPEMDGLTATREIRARERAHGSARLPIIMLTANAMEQHRRQSLDAGADLHVAKPIRAAELGAAIGSLLGEGDAQADAVSA